MSTQPFIICIRCRRRRVHGCKGYCGSCYHSVMKAKRAGRTIAPFSYRAVKTVRVRVIRELVGPA